MKRTAMFLAVLFCLTFPCADRAAAAWVGGFGPPPAGLGLDGDPRALLHHGDGHLYCGGSFSQAGAVTSWFTARLEETAGTYGWTSLGDMDNRVDALAAWGDSVLAGGRFTTAGGVVVNRTAVYHDGSWQPVGDPAAWSWGHVSSMAMHEGAPWAAGTGFVVRWNGAAWEAVTDAAFSGDVFALASFAGDLYAAGAFASIAAPAGSPVTAANIAVWDGTWQPLGAGLDGTGYALEVWNGKLAVGGVFTSPGPLLAAWTGASWASVGPALNGNYVIALASWGMRLLVGGDLNGGGGVSLWNAAYLDGGIWVGMSGGVDGQVRTISAEVEEVAVGGSFLNAGGQPASHFDLWLDPAVAAGDAPAANVTLESVSPNPFNPATEIAFRIAAASHVRLAIHALDGRPIATLLDAPLGAGAHGVVWRGRDDHGRSAASGAYLVKLEAGGMSLSRRITLLR